MGFSVALPGTHVGTCSRVCETGGDLTLLRAGRVQGRQGTNGCREAAVGKDWFDEGGGWWVEHIRADGGSA